MNAPLLPALPGYDNPQLIAHGTTALVFRAVQTNLNRLVAIKVITVDTGSVPVNAARELATTVALSSQPHIVSIIDTGMTEDDRPYIVMEYCEGGSFAQILRQKGPLPVDDVLEVGIKIGEALHAAHQVGIVHRDVKPSNILRGRFGPALTDFGIARAPDELGSTLTREMMTPHHASPEALLHQAQSGPSDIYSLASTLWTLLVGHPPFVDPAQPVTDMYLFRDRVLHDPLPTMNRDDVPPWLLGELTKAMSKLPSQRHATAVEFAQGLRRGALGLSPSPTPTATTSVHTPGVPPQAWPAPEPLPRRLSPRHPSPRPPRRFPPRRPSPRRCPARRPPPPPPSAASRPGAPSSSAPPPAAPLPGAAPAAATPPPTDVRTGTFQTEPRVASPTSPAPAGPSSAPPAPALQPSASQAPPARPAPQAPASPGPTSPRPTSPGLTQPGTAAQASAFAAPPAQAPSAYAAPAQAAPQAPAPARTAPHGAPGQSPPPTAPAQRPAPSPSQAPAPARHPLAPPAPLPPPPSHPLSGVSHRADVELDEGGWLGPLPTTTRRPGDHWTDQPATVAPVLGTRRFEERELVAPTGGRRGGLVAVLVGVAVIAIASASLLLLRDRGTAEEPPVSGPTTFITAATEGVPTEVTLVDNGTAVTITWADPSAGRVSFVIVQKGPTADDTTHQTVTPGTKTVTFYGLDKTRNYCFAVGAVYSVATVAVAPDACTRR